MKFEIRENEWAIVANGENSPTRMDGGRGVTVTGIEGQQFCVYEQGRKIFVAQLAELQSEDRKRNHRR